MNNKFKFINKNTNLIDLGSSPGGWSQVVAKKITKGKILSIDIKPMKKINYQVDNSYFTIQNTFDDILKVNKSCLNKLNYCDKHQNFNMKKEFNYIVFYRK